MIKLNSLTLKHFMCITEAHLKFDNANIVIFEGNNGQGKSAVMKAVAICLSEHKRADSMKEYVQTGFDNATIQLDATLNGEPIFFDVQLNYIHGTPMERDVLYKDKHYINSEVTQLLSDLELTFYSDIILSMQGTSDIATITPTQRLNLLQRLFQFDYSSQINTISTYIDSKTIIMNSNSSRIAYLKSLCAAKEETLKSKEKSKKELPFTEEQIHIKQQEADNCYKKILSYNDSLLKLNVYNKQLQDANKTLYELKSEKALLLNSNTEYEENVKNEMTLHNDIKLYDSAIAENEEKKVSASKQLENDKALLEKYKIDRLAIHDSLSNNSILANSYNEKIKLGEAGKCPICGHSTDDIDISDLHSKVKELNNKNSMLLEQQDLISQNEKKINIYNSTKIVANAESVITSNKDLKQKAEAKVDNLKNKIIAFDVVDYTNKIESNDSQSKELQGAIDKVNKLISSISADANIAEENDKVYKQLQKDITSFNDVVAYNNTILSSISDLNKDLVTYKADIAKLMDSNTLIVKDLEYHEEAKNVLVKELPNYLVVKTCSNLESEMNDFIQIVFPDYRIRLLQNRRGVEFFYAKDKNVDISNIKGLINAKMASGFEKALFSMAFKVALCKAYGLTFAALDEVDQAASEENSSKMFESIINENIFEQLFFITHKPIVCETVKTLSDNLITYHVANGQFTIEEND